MKEDKFPFYGYPFGEENFDNEPYDNFFPFIKNPNDGSKLVPSNEKDYLGNFNENQLGSNNSSSINLYNENEKNNDDICKITDVVKYAAHKPVISKLKWFSYMRIVDPVSYGYLIEALRLLRNVEI